MRTSEHATGTAASTGSPYGLARSEALRALRDGHVEQLPRSNQWKHVLEDHLDGLHRTGDPRLAAVCPLCRELGPNPNVS